MIAGPVGVDPGAAGVDPARFLTGPPGPFPRVPLSDVLERRWLHYAFVTADERQALIANLAALGAEDGGEPIRTSVLLMYHRDHGWTCSQWHAHLPIEPWTSYRSPAPSTAVPRPPDFAMQSRAGRPAVALRLTSTTTPAPAGGRWDDGMVPARETLAVGYHERVLGRWAWPEMGGWVFGFCNQLADNPEGPPRWAVVFALLQPMDEAHDHTAMVMVWRRGRMVQFLPRRALRVTVAGQLARDRVTTTPRLAP